MMRIDSKLTLVSVIVPVFNEQDNLEPLYLKIKKQFQNIDYEFELILIDDGSDDRSYEVIECLSQQDSKVKFLSFSRNFGHQVALSAGLDVAKGDAVILMDADLQHPPEVIPDLLNKWREGFENVFTIRQVDKNIFFPKRLFTNIFYRIFHALTNLNIPANSADFRLLDRKVVLQLRNVKERTRFLRGIINWIGFRSTGIEYKEAQRHSGKVKYHFKNMFLFAIDAICSFSITPLYIGVYVGIIFAFLGFAYWVYVLCIYATTGVSVAGWSSIVSLIGILGGIQLIVMGLIGIYIGKIFEEVKQRPLYVIQKSGGINEPRINGKNTANEEGLSIRLH